MMSGDFGIKIFILILTPGPSIPSIYHYHELQKKRKYGECVQEVSQQKDYIKQNSTAPMLPNILDHLLPSL